MSLGIDEARTLYGETDSVHDFDHILRVFRLAERIGKAEGADLAILRPAALLHDWGRVEAESGSMDHAAHAAARVRSLLKTRGTSSEQIEAVAHAIAAHRFRSGPAPQTLEAQVLFDADKLDAIGAIGIARVFAYSGAHSQRLWASRDMVDVTRWAEEGDDPDEHTAVHEFIVKLSRIKARLYTETGRAIAEDRHRYMVDFFQRLDAEVLGDL
jgi:uncharacterized protein